MDNIKFNDGLKSYTINGDEKKVIRFNPNDVNLVKRFKNAETRIDEVLKENGIMVNADGSLSDESGKTDLIKMLNSIEDSLREIVNDVFNADVYDIVFDGTNPLTTSNGSTILENFLNAMGIIVKSELEKENNKAIKKYQKVYKK